MFSCLVAIFPKLEVARSSKPVCELSTFTLLSFGSHLICSVLQRLEDHVVNTLAWRTIFFVCVVDMLQCV